MPCTCVVWASSGDAPALDSIIVCPAAASFLHVFSCIHTAHALTSAHLTSLVTELDDERKEAPNRGAGALPPSTPLCRSLAKGHEEDLWRMAHLLLEAGHSSRANRPPPCPKGLPHSTPPTPTRYLPTPGAQRRLLAASHLCVPSPDRAQTELRQSSDRAESSNRAHAEIRHISELSQTSLTELKS